MTIVMFEQIYEISVFNEHERWQQYNRFILWSHSSENLYWQEDIDSYSNAEADLYDIHNVFRFDHSILRQSSEKLCDVTFLTDTHV